MAVRRERVILELEDQFTGPIIRAAAATELLNKRLDSLSTEAVQSSKVTRSLEKDTDSLGKTAGRAEKDIDKLSGRLRILADVAAVLGPALIPIGGVGIAAISGLASEFGFAAVGAGTALIAFQGVGDALKAMNKADLEPTAANLQAAAVAFSKLSPAAQSFVTQIHDMLPELKELRDVTAAGLLPGLGAGLVSLETALPRVRDILVAVSQTLGSISADAGASLASDRWAPFLEFIADEAPSALQDLATAIGNTAHAFAGLWMSTEPLNDDFSKWLVNATADLDKWATGLGQTQGFQDFVAYVEKTGPQVADTFGAIANAVIQIVQAAAPLSGPVLKGIEAIANVISTIADSDLGTPLFAGIAALSLYNRTLSVTRSLGDTAFGGFVQGRMKASAGVKTLSADIAAMRAEYGKIGPAQAVMLSGFSKTTDAAKRTRSTIGEIGKSAALIGGVTLASGALSDQFNLTNTTTLALAGSIAGPWGAAVGGGIGLLKDFADKANDADGKAAKYGKTLQNLVDAAGPDLQAQLAAVNEEIDKIQSGGENPHAGEGKGLASARDALNPDSKVDDSKLSQAKELQAQLKDELEKQGVAADAAAAADMRATQAVIDLGYQGILSQKSLDALTKSMEDQVAAANSAFSAETRYREALKDARAQADKNNAGIRGDSDAALKNRETLSSLSDAWNNQSDAVKENVGKYEDAKKSFVQVATSMGVPLKAAQRLARELLQMPTKIAVSIELDGHNTEDKLKRLNDLVRSIPRTWSTQYYVTQVGRINATTGGGRDGDPDTPYAGGGYTGPGSRWEPAGIVHRGEVVWSQDDVAAFGGPMVVDAMRQGLPGYAKGGSPGLGSYIRRDLDMKYPSTLKQWNAALAASTKLLEKEKAQRQKLLDQAQGIRDSVSSNYKSNLFGSPGSSVWMSSADRAKAGTGDVFSTLTGDISNANALTAAEKKLKAKGLDSAAYADLVSNAPLDQVLAFANGSKADVQKYESLYNQRDRAVANAGNVGASAAFGPALAASRAQIAQTAAFTKSIDRIEKQLEKVEKALHGVGPKRPRKGN